MGYASDASFADFRAAFPEGFLLAAFFAGFLRAVVAISYSVRQRQRKTYRIP